MQRSRPCLRLRSRHLVIGSSHRVVYDRIMQSPARRHTVDPSSAEGVAAQYTPGDEPGPADRAVGSDRIFREVAAARVEPALAAEHTRQRRPIQPDEPDQERSDRGAGVPQRRANAHRRSSPLKSSVISLTRSWLFAPTIGALATRTVSRPCPASATCRHAALSTRRARLRCTAPPTRLPATTATRSDPGARNTITRFPRAGRPVSRICLISRERTGYAVSAGQTVKLARPLRRRAARIDRPARVRMR